MKHISNKRKNQLAYCKICEYRDFDNIKGITCALTKNVADFESECPSMRIDFEEVEGQEIDLHNAILDHIRKKYNLFYLKKEHYILPNRPFYSKYYSKENTQKIKIKGPKDENVWTTISSMVLFASIIAIFVTESNTYKLLFGFLIFIAFVFVVIRLVIETHTPAKVGFSTDSKGLIVKGTRIFWHDIVDFRIIYVPGEKGYYDLILGTISGGVQSFSLLDIRITIDQLLEIFSFNRLDYLTRYDRNLPDLL
ncbi:hypothetical protein [Kordia sp.]|uniref:hypothetical protein n=1 Tax=Kordia sp. TaxID=1965332 RepID=UPI0025C6350D|nr:hypothetical protein [Kordia sp.]MCH2194331.1 hypothetical protein [Kordia sp.]